MRIPRLRIWMLMLVVAVVGIALEVRRQLRISRFHTSVALIAAGIETSNREALISAEDDLRDAEEKLAKAIERPGSTESTVGQLREDVEEAKKDITYSRKWTEWAAEKRRVHERVAHRPWERLGKMTVPNPPDDY